MLSSPATANGALLLSFPGATDDANAFFSWHHRGSTQTLLSSPGTTGCALMLSFPGTT
jgi:hypothetical protein